MELTRDRGTFGGDGVTRRERAGESEGALAFLDFLTARAFQDRLRSFPSSEQPGFFPAGFAGLGALRRWRRRKPAQLVPEPEPEPEPEKVPAS